MRAPQQSPTASCTGTAAGRMWSLPRPPCMRAGMTWQVLSRPLPPPLHACSDVCFHSAARQGHLSQSVAGCMALVYGNRATCGSGTTRGA